MEDLYALPPEQFTAARDAAAKELRAAGDKDAAKALAAQRRPTVSAWVVNLLAREESDLVDQLLDLGRALAEAQAARRGDDLRELGGQRRDLVDAVAARAADLAGRPLTAAQRDEVVSTLEAALADPAAGEAVRSGRLVRALSYAGFGEVDVEGAVARPLRLVPPPPPTGGGAASSSDDAEEDEDAKKEPPAVAEAEQAALEAQGALDDAVRAERRAARALADAESALQHAVERADAAERKAEQARRAAEESRRAAERAAAEAARARAQQDSAAGTRDEAASAAETAAGAVEEAQQAAERARDELDRLRRSPKGPPPKRAKATKASGKG